MQLFPSLDKCFGAAGIKTGGCGWKELSPIVNELLHNLLLLGVFIAIGMIMYAGFVLVRGQGSADSRSKVRKIFIGIVIGMVLLVGSYYIVKFILDTLGVTDEYRKNSLAK